MKVAFIGHSHINCMERASQQPGKNYNASVSFVQLRNVKFAIGPDRSGKFANAQFESCDQELVKQAVAGATQGATLAILLPNGNEHVIVSLLNKGNAQKRGLLMRITNRMVNYHHWLIALSRYVGSPAAVIPPPPPIESELHILRNPGQFAERLALNDVAPAQERLRAWLHQKLLIQHMAAKCGLRFLELPREVYSDGGYLHERFLGKDSTHGNEEYGEVILRHVIEFAAGRDFISGAPSGPEPGAGGVAGNQDGAAVTTAPGARRHPYEGLPERAFWKQAVAQVPVQELDPVGTIPFRISRSDRVATAGSCFAQHISKRIRSAGFQFLVTEHPAGDGPDDGQARGFYDFSARFGNLYTARQLAQLFDRAFGHFTPVDSQWALPGNRYCDPFRPRIEPDGFASIEALLEDRRHHLAAVKEMFEQLDVLVFTLGLTECWLSRLDGAAFPLAPGVAGGVYDPARYEFANFGVDEVVADLCSFIHKLRLVNPAARLLLTVSPVPLVATYEPKHVLVSTTYSKSVLRVAADMVSRSCEGVCYFPSFEIITGHYNRGRYFGPDLRSVTEEGVDHVMAVFMRHLTESGEAAADLDESAETDQADEEMTALAEAACDEELLERK